jgi:hypothetical protein
MNRKTFIRNTNKLDFYDTPDICTEMLMSVEKFRGLVFEPACGYGAISKILSQRYEVVSSDVNDYGYGTERDFFSINSADNVVTNPPYNIVEEFVTHALKITKRKVCLLLRLDFLHGQKRYDEIFKNNPVLRLYIFTKRVEFRPEKNRTFGGGMTTAWFVWDKKCKENTEIKFLDCGGVK